MYTVQLPDGCYKELDEYDGYAIRINYYNSQHKLHREDGPAIVHEDGSEEWCYNGLLHRLDGPAIVRMSGTSEWWVGGVGLRYKEHLVMIK